MSEDTDRERLQTLIGEDYRLQWVVGHGGMSTVWLADDIRQNRQVAIKALKPEFSNAPEFLERFRNEAQAAQAIDSENVVRTYDYREVPDPAGTVFCFIVMEYVTGESLADLLSREGALSEELALDVLEQAAHGLAVIHRLGMVHRDIKPGNLLVTNAGTVKITDFGIAKAAAAVPLTRTGMVVGTAQYVSPEQAQGKSVTPASDIYSLGVVGYELLSGRRPFSGDSSVSVVIAHINQEAPPLPTAVSAQARELIDITLRKDPLQRYATGDELVTAVRAVRDGQRPPTPHSSAVAGPAQEPSPTSATVVLGNVANPPAPPMQAARTQAARNAAARSSASAATKKKNGSATGRVVAAVVSVLILAGLVVAGVWAFTAGPLSGTSNTPSSTVITSWVTPTETATDAPTVRSTPRTTERYTEPTTEPEEETTRDTPEPVTSLPEEETPTPTTQQRTTTQQHTTQTSRPTASATAASGTDSGTGGGANGLGGAADVLEEVLPGDGDR